MLQRLGVSRWAFTLSLLLHLGVILLLILRPDWRMPMLSAGGVPVADAPDPAPDRVPAQADLVSERQVLEEIQRIEHEEVATQAQVLGLRAKSDKQLEDLKRKAEEEERRLAEIKRRQETLEKERLAEKQRLAKLEQERKAEEQRKKKAEAERQHLEKAT
ncbi:MAG: hypothetical protein ABFS23_04035, partial [Pseudomonadota bacterium]